MATQAQIDALMAQAQTIKSGVDALATKEKSTSYSSSAAPAPTEDPFITQLKSQMTQQQGIISSAEQDVTRLIREAQGTIKGGAEAGAAAITSQYDREKGYQAEDNARTIDTAREAQRGFATNTALLRQIQESGDKSIKDLEMRKQELILQGNSAAANSLAALQVKEAESLVQNRQQVFQNLISMAGLGLQAGSLQLQKAQMERGMYEFDQGMQAKLGETALQYGIQMQPGDTVESVINRAYPRANEIARLQLDDMRAGLALKNAQASLANIQAREAANRNKPLGETDFANIVKGIQMFGPDYASQAFKSLSESGNMGSIAAALEASLKPKVWNDSDLAQKSMVAYASGQTIGDALEAMRTDTSIQNKRDAERVYRLTYEKPLKDSQLKGLLTTQNWARAGATAAGAPIVGLPTSSTVANWAFR